MNVVKSGTSVRKKALPSGKDNFCHICIVVFKKHRTRELSWLSHFFQAQNRGWCGARPVFFKINNTNRWQKLSFPLESAFFRTLVPDLTTFIKRFYFIRIQRIRHTVKVECCNLTKHILYTEPKIYSMPCYTDKFDNLIISLCRAARESKTQFTYNPHRYITCTHYISRKKSRVIVRKIRYVRIIV